MKVSKSKSEDSKTKPKSGTKKKKKKKKKDIECFVCQKKGHFARDCPERKQNKEADKDKSDRGSDRSRQVAFIALRVNESETNGQNRIEHGWYKTPDSKERRAVLEVDQNDIDSGCSRHVTLRRDWFAEFRPRSDGDAIKLGDNGECLVTGEGTVIVDRLINGVWNEARIEHVLYVPDLEKNLFSVGMCTVRGYSVIFREDDALIVRGNEILATGIKQSNGICRLLFRTRVQQNAKEANVSTTSLKGWHERLGHLNKRALSVLLSSGAVNGVKVRGKRDFFCDACSLGKTHRLPFQKIVERVSREPGEFFYSDVCGPMSQESIGGANYFVTYKDDASGYRQVFFVKHKSDVFETFKIVEREVMNKFGRAMKTLRTDNGAEYCNKQMRSYMRFRGIQHETTAPYTPEQNGRAERDNRTIVECARTMLHAKQLGMSLWAEAVNTAVYLLNRVSATGDNDAKTPYEIWVGKKPDLGHVRAFGEEGYEHVPKHFTRKFDARAKKVILVGYDGESTNYRLYHPETKKVTVSRNVVFRECINEEIYSSDTSDDEEQLIELRENNAEHLEHNGENQVVNRNVVVTSPVGIEEPIVQNENAAEPVSHAYGLRDRGRLRKPDWVVDYEIDFTEYNTPLSYDEAISGPDATQWKRAIEEELRAHEKNCTWEIVPRDPARKTIDSKWVFKVIQSPDGSVRRYKARLCARGFLQEKGVDFEETFSPVVRYDSLRVLLATVTQEDLEMVQFDVRTAFLYGDLQEEIYMKTPVGLKVDKNVSEVECRLIKSLYGLKQAPKCWNRKFCDFLRQFKFVQTDADECIFYSNARKDCEIYLALFVDDGLIACKSGTVLRDVIKKMRGMFEVTVGDSSHFAGLQIDRNRSEKTMFLHQGAYMRKVLERFKMSEAKPLSVPADPNVSLQPVESSEERLCNAPYREAVGSLMFLAIVSRPDIAYAVNTASKFLNKPSEIHWRAVKRILAFLVGTKDVGIMYRSGGSEPQLIGYSDADFASDIETRRSTTGYMFSLANGPVTWASQRQKLVVLSTTEAEFVAASAAAKEAVWLRRLLADIGHQCKQATVLCVDNQSTIRLAKNREFHKRTKHIDTRYHQLREISEAGVLRVVWTSFETQRADIFTKPLPRNRFLAHCEGIGLSERSSTGNI